MSNVPILEPFDDFAELYEITHGEKDDDYDLYHEFAKLAGSPILEVGCGTGRILINLAKDGFAVTGVDLSANMLKIAQKKIDKEPQDIKQRIKLQQQDMCKLQLDEKQFQLVMMPYAEFAHILERTRQRKALNRIAHHLQAGGYLIISMSNWDPKEIRISYPEALKSWGKALPLTYEGVFTDEERHLKVTRYIARGYDPSVQIALHVYIHDICTMDGTVVSKKINPLSIRYVYPNEMALLLEEAGFSVEKIYGSYDKEPFDFQSKRMIFLARKPTGKPTREL